MRVFVTGAAGQLGHDLVKYCRASGDEVIAAGRGELDITDRDSVLAAIMSAHPDVVINCAAWTAVDACEADPEQAWASNALAVRFVREGCDRAGAHLLQISTDYVFDGMLDRPYREWDTPNPQSVYGATKLAGEREAGPDATIVRTSWVCGEYGNNMVKTVLRLLPDHTTLRFVDDQIGHPTFTADLAPVLRRLALDRRLGTYHVTNQGAVSWYEFVRAVVESAGADPDRVQPIATSDLQPPRPAPRPANSVLDNVALRLGGLGELRDFREPLAELIDRLSSGSN